jgi:hypothetical protein
MDDMDYSRFEEKEAVSAEIKGPPAVEIFVAENQCCGSGSVGSICF